MNFSSSDFIKRLKEKDHQALTLIINEYHEALYLGALKQGLASDQAEDVVQQTWGTFFEKVANFEGRSHIRTYIFGIMYNKIKELWRSNKKYTSSFEDKHLEKIFNEDGNYLQSPTDPSDWNESNDTLKVIGQEIQKLPIKQRMAFVLKEIEGESTEEICKMLDISITNLGVLIYRAKHSLRLSVEKKLSEDS